MLLLKNLKTAQEIEDPDERKKQWIKIVLALYWNMEDFMYLQM